jgi:hypothetical protein
MLQAIVAIVSLFGILVYFLGWTYLYNYLEFFRIDAYEVEPSVQYVLVNAYPAVLFLVREPAITLFIIPFGMLAWWAFAGARGAHTTAIKAASVAVLSITVAAVAYDAAWHAGIVAARARWMGNSNPVFLSGVDGAGKCAAGSVGGGLAAPLACHNEEFALREILVTPHFNYLFMREACSVRDYRTCGGLIFRVAADGKSYTTTLHAGEPR